MSFGIKDCNFVKKKEEEEEEIWSLNEVRKLESRDENLIKGKK